MKRNSLGIILQGNPNYKQKSKIPSLIGKILVVLCVILGVGGIVMILSAIGKGSEKMLHTGMCAVLWAAILLLISMLWGSYGRCPFCGHFFTLKRISADKFISQSERTVARNVDTYHSGMAYDFHGNSAFFAGKSTHKEYGIETTTEYAFNSRCSCCQAVVKIMRLSFETK